LHFLLVDFQASRVGLEHALQFHVAALEARPCFVVEKSRHAVDEGDQERHLPASGDQVPK
jgi:hypothetical protein